MAVVNAKNDKSSGWLTLLFLVRFKEINLKATKGQTQY